MKPLMIALSLMTLSGCSDRPVLQLIAPPPLTSHAAPVPDGATDTLHDLAGSHIALLKYAAQVKELNDTKADWISGVTK